MIVILSPAKTLDFEKKSNFSKYSIPTFLEESTYLITELRKKNKQELSDLMSISSKLSALNLKRYHNWNPDFNLSNSKQSILCFKGGVYVGLDVDSFSEEDVLYSQDYLKIISGLHGVLNPLDLIQPYRLEMGTKLSNKKGASLYNFWGEKITDYLNESLEKSNSSFLLNLASNEYFSSVIPKKIRANVIDVKFLDNKNGVYKVISFFAKKARGAMAGFVMKNKIQHLSDLKNFSELGYTFDASNSDMNSLVFIR